MQSWNLREVLDTIQAFQKQIYDKDIAHNIRALLETIKASLETLLEQEQETRKEAMSKRLDFVLKTVEKWGNVPRVRSSKQSIIAWNIGESTCYLGVEEILCIYKQKAIALVLSRNESTILRWFFQKKGIFWENAEIQKILEKYHAKFALLWIDFGFQRESDTSAWEEVIVQTWQNVEETPEIVTIPIVPKKAPIQETPKKAKRSIEYTPKKALPPIDTKDKADPTLWESGKAINEPRVPEIPKRRLTATPRKELPKTREKEIPLIVPRVVKINAPVPDIISNNRWKKTIPRAPFVTSKRENPIPSQTVHRDSIHTTGISQPQASSNIWSSMAWARSMIIKNQESALPEKTELFEKLQSYMMEHPGIYMSLEMLGRKMKLNVRSRSTIQQIIEQFAFMQLNRGEIPGFYLHPVKWYIYLTPEVFSEANYKEAICTSEIENSISLRWYPDYDSILYRNELVFGPNLFEKQIRSSRTNGLELYKSIQESQIGSLRQILRKIWLDPYVRISRFGMRSAGKNLVFK